MVQYNAGQYSTVQCTVGIGTVDKLVLYMLYTVFKVLNAALVPMRTYHMQFSPLLGFVQSLLSPSIARSRYTVLYYCVVTWDGKEHESK